LLAIGAIAQPLLLFGKVRRVTRLASRWKGLTSLPHVDLGIVETPVEVLPHLSKDLMTEVWCKRDDKTSPLYGGNKVRKLEFLFGEARARGAKTVITVGALGSHHVLATSLFGKQAGFEVHAVLGPQAPTEHVRENILCDLAADAKLHIVPSFAFVPPAVQALNLQLRLLGKCPFIIPAGGSNDIGALGYVEAGLELAAQLDRGDAPETRAIYMPLGTGGTVAGAAVGLAAMGITAEIVAVRVTAAALANRHALKKLVYSLVSRLQTHDSRFPDVRDLALRNIRIDSSEYGKGYGLATDAGRDATARAARDGLIVETTYTAKALAGLLREARNRYKGEKVMYWHTLSSADLSPLIARAPVVPRSVQRYLDAR
jgi:1-aminocyclopropane-1-carboxylate deaminase/D-cysteine desulfhydrase-like pyridoxal-dependent ACC family enzyme